MIYQDEWVFDVSFLHLPRSFQLYFLYHKETQIKGGLALLVEHDVPRDGNGLLQHPYRADYQKHPMWRSVYSRMLKQ